MRMNKWINEWIDIILSGSKNKNKCAALPL